MSTTENLTNTAYNGVDKSLISKVNLAFSELFKMPAQHFVQSPGRVNLIGEHTDYNEGFVLPCAINYHTLVAVSLRDDSQVHVVALDYNNQKDIIELDKPLSFNSSPEMMWSNYIRGVLAEIIKSHPSIKGMNIVVSGNVPQGAGLSSSASLEIAIAQTVNQLNALNLSEKELAIIGQAAENNFVGCNCGIMDQMVVAAGELNHAMLLDCRSLAIEAIALPKNLNILIINSNKKRGLVDSEYNLRRQSCEQVAKTLGVSSLRDINIDRLMHSKDKLDTISFKRALHVITENQRTLDATIALKTHDLATLSNLMQASHQSMKEDFEITVPEIDLIVSLCHEVIQDQGGVRMTGGGFGGCVVALIPQELIKPVIETVEKNYQKETGLIASFYLCQSASGAGLLDIRV
ncbi:galactokinase [Thorsellia kenyensis]|uniref:Galactokinase n=1 Tax=Thorsellia kenyensis TaxID=1549888 RepID=A0ABV6CIE4_9GAMM